MIQQPELLSCSDSDDESTFQKITLSKSTSHFISNMNHYCKNTLQKFSKYATNACYNARHSSLPMIQRKPVQLVQNGEPVSLLGKTYTYEEKQAFIQHFQSTIWISYRSGIYGVQNDIGWGCMIRVVQMIFAQTFHRHFPSMYSKQIITFFQDTPQAYFSLTRICEEGNIHKRWTSAPEVLNTFKKLIERQKNIGLSVQIFTNDFKIENQNDLSIDTYPCLLSINNKIGSSNFPSESISHLLYLFNNEDFIGMAGGVSGQGLYIIGSCGDKAIYLDPHYVQEVNQDIDNSQYFKHTPRMIPINSLSSSFTIFYYIRRKEDLDKWLKWVLRSGQIFQTNLAIDIKIKENQSRERKQSQDLFENLE